MNEQIQGPQDKLVVSVKVLQPPLPLLFPLDRKPGPSPLIPSSRLDPWR